MIDPSVHTLSAHLRIIAAHHERAMSEARQAGQTGRRNPFQDPAPVTPAAQPKGADSGR